jgi:two-component system, OmpR family, sensor histidine kinase SenX3
LQFAATRDGVRHYNFCKLAVPEIIEATLAATAGLIRSAEFTVEQNLEPRLPAVAGDLPALSQCLQNLITNAVKYGSKRRWIGIRAATGQRGERGKEIQISVSDRGMGIASSDLPYIFEPFYRSPLATASQIRGTGLGLSLAKGIAEAMNGDLTVSSVPGEGSTFTLHLPFAEPSLANDDIETTPLVAQHERNLTP